MHEGAAEAIPPDQPSLIVTQGNTSRPCRSLDNDVIVLGRAPGCDIGLDADDVSALHCVLFRTPAGFRVRNYSRRNNTRLNGAAIQEALLNDGDILQIGTFCFRVSLPASTATLGLAVLSKKRLLRLEESRRNLARLALRLRRRLREAPVDRKGSVEAQTRPVPLTELLPIAAQLKNITESKS